MKEIKYEKETNCPAEINSVQEDDKIKVGSLCCELCRYHLRHDTEKKIVFCSSN